MQRVVFDTNIFISAFNFLGLPRTIFERALQGDFQLVISKQIIVEMSGVLRKKFNYDLPELEEVEQFLIMLCEIVEPKRRIKRIIEDPSDNMILECAVEGKADYIVSGDKHLLKLKKFESVPILQPSDFLKKISKT